MTGLCPDVDIDRKILQSGVCVDRKFYIQCVSCAQMLILMLQCHTMLNLCPNVYTDGKMLHLGVCVQMLISIVNIAFVTSRGLKAYLHGTTLSHATSLRQAYDMT